MSGLAFTIPGDPRGKGRPRATVFKGREGVPARARLYTDSKTVAYENLVRLAGDRAMHGRAPFECPLSMTLVIRMVPTKSTTKRDRLAMLAGDIQPAKKPDLSNILKAVEDGLNGVAYRDDCQIVRLVTDKIYAETPGVDVSIEPYRRAA